MVCEDTDRRITRRCALARLSTAAGVALLPSRAGSESALADEAPDGAVRWEETYGPTDRATRCNGLVPAEDGYYMAGSTNSSQGTLHGWIAHVDAEGEKRWEITDERLSDEAPLQAVTTSREGGPVVAGEVTEYTTDSTDLTLLSFDADGELQWNGQYGPGWNATMHSIARTDDGYVAAGYARSYSTHGTVVLLLSVDEDGSEQWLHSIGESGAVDVCYDVRPNGDGYTLAGGTNAIDEESRLWLVHVDENGDVEWEQTYTVDGDYSTVQSLLLPDDGGYLLGGLTGSSEHIFRAVVVKTDEQGNEEWRWLNETESACHALTERPDGGYAMAGKQLDEAWLGALTADGDLVASESYTGDGAGRFDSIHATDEGYVVGGWTNPFDMEANRAWLVSTERLAGPDAEPIDEDFSLAERDDEDDGLPGFGVAAGVAGVGAAAYALGRGLDSDSDT